MRSLAESVVSRIIERMVSFARRRRGRYEGNCMGGWLLYSTNSSTDTVALSAASCFAGGGDPARHEGDVLVENDGCPERRDAESEPEQELRDEEHDLTVGQDPANETGRSSSCSGIHGYLLQGVDPAIRQALPAENQSRGDHRNDGRPDILPCGGDERIRTADLCLAKAALSQLSHVPTNRLNGHSSPPEQTVVCPPASALSTRAQLLVD